MPGGRKKSGKTKYRRSKRSTYKGRTGKSRKTYHDSKAIIRFPAGAAGGLPARMYTTFTYSESIVDTSAGGASTGYYALNSLYDPGQAVFATQPYFYDQLCSANTYLRYKVYACQVSISVINEEAADQLFFGVCPSIYTTAVSSAAQFRQLPQSKWVWLTQAGGSKSKGSIKLFTKTKDVFAVKDLDSPDFGAAFSADPTGIYYLRYLIRNNDAGNLNTHYHIRLKYFCVLYDLANPAIS